MYIQTLDYNVYVDNLCNNEKTKYIYNYKNINTKPSDKSITIKQ